MAAPPQQQLYEKAEVHQLIKTALATLGRTNEPYNDGAVQHQDPAQHLIYFDLPHISPLQFNITVASDMTREALVEIISKTIKRRIDIRSS